MFLQIKTMLERDHVLFSVILVLVILILAAILWWLVVRQIKSGCFRVEHEVKDASEMVKLGRESYIDYSFEAIQPETNESTVSDEYVF